MKKNEVIAMFSLVSASKESQGKELKIDRLYTEQQLFKRSQDLVLAQLMKDLISLDEISPDQFHKYFFGHASMAVEKLSLNRPTYMLVTTNSPTRAPETFAARMLAGAKVLPNHERYESRSEAAHAAGVLTKVLQENVNVERSEEGSKAKRSSKKTTHLMGMIEQWHTPFGTQEPQDFIDKFDLAKRKVGEALADQYKKALGTTQEEYTDFVSAWFSGNDQVSLACATVDIDKEVVASANKC